ncbi:conjugal transfer protein TraB [Skermanella stibiiresistens SB22]|uniref:Conjugal transfer protein TraB n=1 Tax=Skermanella stibiiresistens SB22 TaxID=1385369 RepID=W9GXG0_9PROT|nr:TrbI/VirB10 family protein [Skermanella stibiiresistens]EWY36153.1 conjugal transfer protein TraB [Skermanella stibiiresistens SB22]
MIPFVQQWQALPAGVRRWIVMGGAGAVGLAILLGAVALQQRDPPPPKQKKIEQILADTGRRELGVDGISAQVQALAAKNAELERTVRELKDQAVRIPPSPAALPPASLAAGEELGQLRQEMQELRRLATAAAGTQLPGPAGSPSVRPAAVSPQAPPIAGSAGGFPAVPVAPPQPKAPADLSKVFSHSGGQLAGGGGVEQMQGMTVTRPVKIIESTAPAPTESKADTAKTPAISTVVIPSGAILSGTLITGLDAPTGQGARQEPFPILLRVKREALMPNRFRADIRECFLLMSGYGELSSERAIMRGETVSCVRADGVPAEAEFRAYAVGEDGKAGIRGRLVSKQGQMIGNALMAGFADGIGKAFDVKPVPVISTSAGRSGQYQDNFSTDSFRSAGVSGVSSALDRIATWYLKQADEVFPVIEVDAGRQVDVVLTGAMKLEFGKPLKVEPKPQASPIPMTPQAAAGAAAAAAILKK